jgi:hypothetical protein
MHVCVGEDLKGTSKGGHDAWFGLFDSMTGALKWKKQIGSTDNDWLYKLICDPLSKNILVQKLIIIQIIYLHTISRYNAPISLHTHVLVSFFFFLFQ